MGDKGIIIRSVDHFSLFYTLDKSFCHSTGKSTPLYTGVLFRFLALKFPV